VQNFQILIISAVNICKQCFVCKLLQLLGEFQTSYRGFAPGHHWGLPSPSWARPLPPKWIFLAAPLHMSVSVQRNRVHTEPGKSWEFVEFKDHIFQAWNRLEVLESGLGRGKSGGTSWKTISCGEKFCHVAFCWQLSVTVANQWRTLCYNV